MLTQLARLQPQEITRLILGAPSTYVTLQLSDGPDRSAATGRSKTRASPAATGGSSVVTTPRSVHRAGTLGGFKPKASPRKPGNPDRLSAHAAPAPDQNRSVLPQVEGTQIDISPNSQREVTIVRADGHDGSFTGIGIQFGRRKQSKEESTYIIQGMKPDFPAAKSGMIALGDLLHAVSPVLTRLAFGKLFSMCVGWWTCMPLPGSCVIGVAWCCRLTASL
jgi:hypothetical protein